MSHPSGYLRCDDSFDRHNTVVQHPMLPLPSSSSSSELGNALGEIASPDAQTMNRALIALPGLPRASQTAHEHDSQTSESTIGHNPVKTEYDATAGGQSFSPLNSPSVTGDHVPYTKEEDQEQMCAGTSSMPRSSPPLHGHGFLRHRQNTLESFRLVQDPAAYPGFASTGKVCSCAVLRAR
ncbi:hypothetical protein BJV74DRAFT_299543 [Russula compacta]|nr:hypothetical protein BJV74DRAFT_299543 [Russula compacta]